MSSTFQKNSSPWEGGALSVVDISFVDISQTTFASINGAIFVDKNSSLVIYNCYFSVNTAVNFYISNHNKNITGRRSYNY